MWDNIVAWVEKKAGPLLVKLETAEEVNVFFDEKSREATPSGRRRGERCIFSLILSDDCK